MENNEKLLVECYGASFGMVYDLLKQFENIHKISLRYTEYFARTPKALFSYYNYNDIVSLLDFYANDLMNNPQLCSNQIAQRQLISILDLGKATLIDTKRFLSDHKDEFLNGSYSTVKKGSDFPRALPIENVVKEILMEQA